MRIRTIKIPLEEYKRLKEIEKKIDFNLVKQFENSLDDLKKDRFKIFA